MKSIQIILILVALLFVSEDTFASSLSTEEKEGIQLMREEEKLAHDVYLFLYEKWELPVFSNIAQAETKHFNAIGFLIENFELEDLATKKAGNYENQELQHLYDSLTQKGSESLIAALQVGAFIEEVDIQDLQNLVNTTSNETILNTYQNLLRASRNHLRAFTSQLESRNNAYLPTVLNEKEYLAILDTPHQRGGDTGNCKVQNNGAGNQNGGNGKMRRYRGGRN